MGSVVSLRTLIRIRRGLKRRGQRVVFTNGTFDILHRGHADYLQAARRLGDVLVVGLNTDASIKRIKGPLRPINTNQDRARLLAALACVDYVCFFDDDTPAHIIAALLPDILVKGADWKKNDIVGHEVVEAHGGKVRRIRLTPGRSTTNTIHRVLAAYGTARRRKRPTT